MIKNKQIAAVLLLIVLIFATGYSIANTIMFPITPTGQPTYYGEMLGCCAVAWLFIVILFVFNKLNNH